MNQHFKFQFHAFPLPPCIMSVQYTGGTMSTLDGVQYSGVHHDECGDLMSKPGDVQCTVVSIQIQLFSQ